MHSVVVVGQAHVALMLNVVGATSGAFIQIIVGAKFSAFDVGDVEPIFVPRGLSFVLILIIDFGHRRLLRLFDLWSTGYSWLRGPGTTTKRHSTSGHMIIRSCCNCTIGVDPH